MLPALVVLIGCALPGLALSGPPSATPPEKIAAPAATRVGELGRTQAKQAKAKAGQSLGGRKPRPASEDASKQPYQPLVDAVRKSSEAFGEENVSESGERDRLQDPPPR